jgi:hypothetical protein
MADLSSDVIANVSEILTGLLLEVMHFLFELTKLILENLQFLFGNHVCHDRAENLSDIL